MAELSRSPPGSPKTRTVDKMMAIPHLVTNIINFARQDRKTLARLMRTNKNFYKAVGPVLYHTVWIWEETMDSFFKGTFKPCHCAECNARVKQVTGYDHDKGCFTEFGKLVNQPHHYGKYTNPAPRDFRPASATSPPGKPAPAKKPATLNKSAKLRKLKTAKSKPAKPSKSVKATNAERTPEASPSKSSTASSPGPKTPEDSDDEPEIKLPISKKELFGYVRVLTLGGHHESACEIYAEQLEKYMTNLEVLRIVETPAHPFQTFALCENIPGGSCPFVDAVNPRKLVVRNVSGKPLPFPPLWELADRTKEVVFVLPTEHQRYGDMKVRSLAGLL